MICLACDLPSDWRMMAANNEDNNQQRVPRSWNEEKEQWRNVKVISLRGLVANDRRRGCRCRRCRSRHRRRRRRLRRLI